MDLYSLLEVDSQASDEAIKKAYRKKVLQCHPDLVGSEHANLFRDVTTAYNTLINPELRSEYDLSFLFVNQKQVDKSQRLKLYVDLELTLEEVAFGCMKSVEFNVPHACNDCKGTGVETSTKVEVCVDCKGEGIIHETTQTLFGEKTLNIECQGCYGKGFFQLNDCIECDGRGHIKQKVEHKVDVPPGVSDGQKLTKSLDTDKEINFVIHVNSHPYLERIGTDLACTKIVSLKEAIFGSKSYVETLDGRKALTIQPGTQSGKIIRLKGLGINELGGRNRGDLLVRFIVDIPSAKEMDKDERSYLRKFFDEKYSKKITDSGILNTESDIINIYSKENNGKRNSV